MKFKESVEVAINLGVDAKKSDQAVREQQRPSWVWQRGESSFSRRANVDAATKAGADVVGMDDLADEVKKGNMN